MLWGLNHALLAGGKKRSKAVGVAPPVVGLSKTQLKKQAKLAAIAARKAHNKEVRHAHAGDLPARLAVVEGTVTAATADAALMDTGTAPDTATADTGTAPAAPAAPPTEPRVLGVGASAVCVSSLSDPAWDGAQPAVTEDGSSPLM